jgi:hypothetical protein
MNKIIEYKVIVAENISQLEYETNLAIQDGWQPFGNIDVDMLGKMFRQMVKYESVKQ